YPSTTISLILCHSPTHTLNYTLSLHDALPILIGKTTTTLEELNDFKEENIKLKQLNSDLEQELACKKKVIEKYTHNSYAATGIRSEEHTSELQSRFDLVCRLLLEKKNKIINNK